MKSIILRSRKPNKWFNRSKKTTLVLNIVICNYITILRKKHYLVNGVLYFHFH